MSRTTRTYPYGFNKGEAHYRDADARHEPGRHPGNFWRHLHGYDFRKAHVYHGRDGAMSSDIGAPFSKGRDCYSSWNEVWGMHRKRRAKYVTGRLRRVRSAAITCAAVEENARGD